MVPLKFIKVTMIILDPVNSTERERTFGVTHGSILGPCFVSFPKRFPKH